MVVNSTISYVLLVGLGIIMAIFGTSKVTLSISMSIMTARTGFP